MTAVECTTLTPPSDQIMRQDRMRGFLSHAAIGGNTHSNMP